MQTIYSPTGDEIYQVLITEQGQLRIIGHHFGGTSSKAYQTVGFFVAMKPQNQDIRSFIKKGGKGYELRFDDNTDKYVKDVNDNGYITTTYYFPDNFLSEMFRINNISETATGDFSFYISNIFRVIYFPQGRGKPFVYTSEACYSLAEIRAASTWSSKTYSNFTHYYDMKITIKRSWVKSMPTPTPTKKPTNTPTPTKRPTNTPTPTRRPTNTPTPTPHPTNTPTPRPTNTPTPRPTNTPTPTPSSTPTPTPFQCKLVAGSDNRKYVQLIEPDKNAVPLVIENCSEMNDFYVRIVNNPQGIAGQGDLRNEIRFPFDLYDDTENNGNAGNTVTIPAMTWYEIGDGVHHLYPAGELKEGTYLLEGRTTLKSGSNRDGNVLLEKTDSIPVQVSGRITDFKVSVVSGKASGAASGLFSSGTYNIKTTNGKNVFYAGIRDRFGRLNRTELSQLPLFTDNSGTELKLEVTTCGKESEKGNVNVKLRFRTPEGKPVEMFYYAVKANGARTLMPYDSEITMMLSEIKDSEQTRTCRFLIPKNSFAVIKGERGEYSGPVIVNSDITLVSDKGKPVLSYANSANEADGFCNMWHFQETATEIADEVGHRYELLPGDVMILDVGTTSAISGNVRLLY